MIFLRDMKKYNNYEFYQNRDVWSRILEKRRIFIENYQLRIEFQQSRGVW